MVKRKKKLNPRLSILVEGKKGNKSETTYFKLLNSCQKARDKRLTIATYQTHNQLRKDMKETLTDRSNQVVVMDTDYNATSHDKEILKKEIRGYISKGYTVYLSNKNWEGWISNYFNGGLPADYEKTEKWYNKHKEDWIDELDSVISASIEKCQRLHLPHGISTEGDLDSFEEYYDLCQEDPFSMV